ncbi:MAG TPA: endolytic transglycosylase MltG [Pyrinomonadaceae bacterium]|nr:endolytic transglycosylase MltG [Pyrinomonadaceae bacterium]
MKRKGKFIALSFLLLCVAAGGFLFWTYRELRAPVAHDKADKYIEIPRGLSPSQIVSRLASEGIIKREWPLLAYIKLTGAGARLKAGEYRFPSPISPLGVLRKLEEGEERLSRFTIIEGWSRFEIAAAMARIPELKLEGPEQALALMNDTSAIDDIDPGATNLEGYLYPDTYNFPPDATPVSMIAAMVKRFRQQWKPEWTEKARSLDLSPRQIVTVASLIETEAKLPEERPIIASVVYNRLKKKMALGIDSSVIYASKLAGKWKNDGKVYKSDLDRQSPYNTRLNAGLPPGPIASPSLSSLQAALNPAQTDYLYYVREPSRDDGAHNFYNNAADFERGVQALRNWERERDTRGTTNASGSEQAQ